MYVMPTTCALGADCRRAWQGRVKMPLVCLAGQVLFFAFSDLYECGSIIFPMRMARFVDERNGQAPCAIVGKTSQKVVRRVFPRTPKERAAKAGGALYCCCRECFLKGFCASVCFQGYCVSAQGKRRHMPQAAFYSGRQGCSTHGGSKVLRAQNGRLPALSTHRGLCRDRGQRYAISQTVLQIVTNCGAALQKKHVAGKYNLQNRKHFNGGASHRLGLQGGRSGV